MSKSESTNKLRRISHLKQKGSGVDKTGERRNAQDLVLQSNTQATGVLASQYTASGPTSGNTRYLNQPGQQPMQSIGSGNASSSNLMSFQNSQSERTSVTDEAHASALIGIHWQAKEDNQCSTERYKNE